MPLRTYVPSSPGAENIDCIPWTRSEPTSSSTCDGCKKQRRYKPSTVCRRLSILVGFYRTCVIDGVLETAVALLHSDT